MELTAPWAGDAGPTPTVPPAVRPVRSDNPLAAGAAAPKWPDARFRDVIGSELIKFRSTRTGPLILAGTLVGVGTAMLFATIVGRYPDFDTDQLRSFDPTDTILRGRSIMQITIGVLGALAVTSEYGAGTIVPSLAAVPNRARLFAAKTLTISGISARGRRDLSGGEPAQQPPDDGPAELPSATVTIITQLALPIVARRPWPGRCGSRRR
jgi:hypothetical protein